MDKTEARLAPGSTLTFFAVVTICNDKNDKNQIKLTQSRFLYSLPVATLQILNIKLKEKNRYINFFPACNAFQYELSLSFLIFSQITSIELELFVNGQFIVQVVVKVQKNPKCIEFELQ